MILFQGIKLKINYGLSQVIHIDCIGFFQVTTLYLFNIIIFNFTFMKLNKLYFLLLIGITLAISACHARKNKCNSCPHWSKQSEIQRNNT